MAELILRIGNRLMFSRRNRCVRRSVILLFTNFMIAASVVFILEVALILLGIGDVFIPLTHNTRDILAKIFL